MNCLGWSQKEVKGSTIYFCNFEGNCFFFSFIIQYPLFLFGLQKNLRMKIEAPLESFFFSLPLAQKITLKFQFLFKVLKTIDKIQKQKLLSPPLNLGSNTFFLDGEDQNGAVWFLCATFPH